MRNIDYKKYTSSYFPFLLFFPFARQEHNLRKEGVERKGKETWKFTYNASFP